MDKRGFIEGVVDRGIGKGARYIEARVDGDKSFICVSEPDGKPPYYLSKVQKEGKTLIIHILDRYNSREECLKTLKKIIREG